MKIVNTKYKGFNLYIIDYINPEDKSFIKSMKDDIFILLKEAYKNINGCDIYKSSNHMIKSVTRYKLIIKNNKLFAAATYNHIKDKNSYKCTLIGG